MRLTPAAANLLVAAIDRADRERHRWTLSNLRAAFYLDDKKFAAHLAKLKR